MENKDIVLLLHGPFQGNAFKKIFSQVEKVADSRKIGLKILIVSYIKDLLETEELVKNINITVFAEVISCKDTINPGFFNFNRQVRMVRAGLEQISQESFVIKLRNDQWVDFEELFSILERECFLENGTQRIITTNCYTRKDRLYHPSDMFLCGWRAELSQYYAVEEMQQTHLDYELEMVHLIKYAGGHMQECYIAPESRLFRNFLQRKAWPLQNTAEDSYCAIREFCIVLNSWEISLHWNKKRVPFLKSGSLVLPYSFAIAPIKGLPIEHAECYAHHEFGAKKTIADGFWLGVARVCFAMDLRTRLLQYIRRLQLRFMASKRFMSFVRQSPFWDQIKKIAKKI